MKNFLFASIFVLAFCVCLAAQTKETSICPRIEITGPWFVPKAGDIVSYIAHIDEKGKDLKLEYVWSIKGGKILEGQGTTSIKVEFPYNGKLNVTVEVKGFPMECPNTYSESIGWNRAPEAVKVDGFSDSISKIDKARIERVVKEIQNDPTARLYIIVGYAGKTLPKATTRREREISNILVKQKRISANRIVIVRELSDKALMQFWIVPAGASFPQPKKK
jgi:hypothetical protein